MARQDKEHYIKNLSPVHIVYNKSDESLIDSATILKSRTKDCMTGPYYSKDGKVCVQGHMGFRIIYPIQYVYNWPRDIWLPNPEADRYMMDELAKAEKNVLGYYNDQIFLFFVKDEPSSTWQSIKNLCENIVLITHTAEKGLEIRAIQT